MRILSEFQIDFQLPAPTPMVALLELHPSLDNLVVQPDEVRVEHVEGDAPTRITPGRHLDCFGNRCLRFAAPAGAIRISGSNLVEHSGFADEIRTEALQAPIDQLPPEVLQFLLASRYCQVDQMGAIANDLFGATTPGWPRAIYIRDWVHNHVLFNYATARPTKTALDVFTERIGVCRDFQHLAITLTRAMNIPARYVTGHLGDIRIPFSGAGDFSAWYEVFLDNRWWTMDARHNTPRIGRILMATGRDATDVAITTSFGIANLAGFRVESNEVDTQGNKVPLPPPLAPTSPVVPQSPVSSAPTSSRTTASAGEVS